jgi:hypothetical protein
MEKELEGVWWDVIECIHKDISTYSRVLGNTKDEIRMQHDGQSRGRE